MSKPKASPENTECFFMEGKGEVRKAVINNKSTGVNRELDIQ